MTPSKRALFVLAVLAALAIIGVVAMRWPVTSQIDGRSLVGADAATGTISRWDPSSRILTVRTSRGRLRVRIVDETVVRVGPKVVVSGDLGLHTGEMAKVRYSQADGRMVAEAVMIRSEKTVEP